MNFIKAVFEGLGGVSPVIWIIIFGVVVAVIVATVKKWVAKI